MTETMIAAGSALARTAAELLRRHRPDGTTACPACGSPSPCPVALGAEEVCRAAAATDGVTLVKS